MNDRTERVRQLFDDKAATWSTKYAAGGVLHSRLTRFRTTLETLIQPPALVLDLGCGTGDLVRELARHGYRVFGADVAPAMLQRAQELSGGVPATWVPLDVNWTVLPFEAHQFDAIV